MRVQRGQDTEKALEHRRAQPQEDGTQKDDFGRFYHGTRNVGTRKQSWGERTRHGWQINGLVVRHYRVIAYPEELF